jgi:hypothetical protein
MTEKPGFRSQFGITSEDARANAEIEKKEILSA